MTFEQRKAQVIERLQAGYDPEQENGMPVRSDVWQCAQGWQDALLDEAIRAQEDLNGQAC